MIKIFNYFFQALFIYFFFIIGKIIGLNLSRKLFSFIFLKFAPFFKSRKVLEFNLKNFNKDISLELKTKIINSMWKNYGMTFIEYIYLDYFKKNNSHTIIEGEKNLNDVLLNEKPVIFVSGHFANFELMSMEITKKEIKLATIYRPLNNIFLNPFMEYLRKKYICKNQIKKGIKGVKNSIEYINKGYSIALMIDQRVSEGEKVNFFGKPALTTTLPAQLAIKFNLPIVPVSIKRSEDNKFIIKFHDKINSSEFKDKLQITNRLNHILENMIIDNPYQWIWTHDRWK